jgi:aminoglycoside phosphotransferase
LSEYCPIDIFNYSQTQQGQHRFNKNRGYVCTLSAMIIKSNTAHTFHLGDTRIYRLRNHSLEQLTKDHRLWVSEEKSYLSRAMGMHERLELDYKTLPIDKGDIFLLTTDGIYEFVNPNFMVDTINAQNHNLDNAAKMIVEKAYQQGSDDNLTVQIIRIDDLPQQDADEIYQQLTELPFPPILEARAVFDGYKIIRTIHASSRSHIYLAVDIDTNRQIVIKTPSTDLQEDPAYLERFLLEEWIARRISSPHVLKPCLQTRKRNFLYIVTEFIEGQTLTQWMIDNPKPNLETVRNIVEQIAKGLRAFHRLEMLHQDLRPENIMIDSTGTVKIIDFGATKVAGIEEISSPIKHANRLGTAQYTAPEYMLGELGSSRSDLFSLGVITYQMLTGKLPYGTQVAKTTTKAEQKKLIRLVLLSNLILPDFRGEPNRHKMIYIPITSTMRRDHIPCPKISIPLFHCYFFYRALLSQCTSDWRISLSPTAD